MNRTVTVRGTEFGRGVSRICVPVTGYDEKEILLQAEKAVSEKPDLIEWRADLYAEHTEPENLVCILEKLRNTLQGIPLLFTLRSEHEGGKYIYGENSQSSIQSVISSGFADILDVEYTCEETLRDSILKSAKEAGIFTIMSSHYFHITPYRQEILKRISEMEGTGGDILKIATMPFCAQDVLELLYACEIYTGKTSSLPLAAMSMGNLGRISRVSGPVFGSCITFGTVGEQSAPGQIEINQLRSMMECLAAE